jgi:reductive dehalogenase
MVRATETEKTEKPGQASEVERPDPMEKMVVARAGRGDFGEVAQRNQRATIDKSIFRRLFFFTPRPENNWKYYLSKVVDGPLNPERTEVTDSAQMSADVKEVARFLGTDMVGISPLNQAFVFPYHFEGERDNAFAEQVPIENNHRYAISLGVEMNLAKIKAAPSYIDNAEVGLQYHHAARVAVELAAFIRELGYPARAHHMDNEEVLHVPLAVSAGMGELGRMGMLVTRRFGPRLRLATVTTDLPLDPDKPVSLGVDAFCCICKKCATNCPIQAVPMGEKAPYKGVNKWKIDQEACIRFWTTNPEQWASCLTCLKACPWSQPDAWYHRASTWTAARSRVARRLLLWMDDAMHGKHPFYNVSWMGFRSKRVGTRTSPPAK